MCTFRLRSVRFRLIGRLSLVLLLCAGSSTARADFFLIDRIDLDADFGPVGNNPSAVAFDGTYAYIGGYNGSGITGDVSILKINVLNPADKTVLAGSTQTVQNNRFYHGLVYRDGVLYAMMDRPDGAVNNTNVRAIDPVTGALIETFDGDDALNPGNGSVKKPAGMTVGATGGLAWDPGYLDQGGSGVAFFGFGSGRRHSIDPLTGTTLYSSGTGFIASDGTFPDQSAWRDVWLDGNGDIYQRRSNQVQRGLRNGANSLSAREHLTDELNTDGTPRTGPGDGKAVGVRLAAFVVGQNLAVIQAGGGAGPQDLVIFNDRPSPSDVPPPLSFANTIKLIRTDGSAPAPAVQLLKQGGGPLDPLADVPDGGGFYDFHYEPGLDLLLILDFSNRKLLVFNGTPPTPGACCLATGACTEVIELQCQGSGGVFHGPGSSCTPRPCKCSDPFADDDGDGDVDMVDFAAFQRCYSALSSPGVPVAPECECFDRDNVTGDGDIDLDDLTLFLGCASGPGIAADTTCDGGI